MAKVYNYVTTNYEKDIYTPSIDMMQGDTGRGLIFSIASPIDGLESELSNLTATLNVVKPTGETQTVTGTIESLGNDMAKVTIEPSSDLASAIDVSGLAMATLVIANAAQTVTSFNFKIKIKPNPFYPKPTVRKFDVTKVSRITGVQQYEHCVQSIEFVGLNYTGNMYIVLNNDAFVQDLETEGYHNTVPLTNNTFIIGQPMTLYSGTFECQLLGETTSNGETTKFEISPIFYIEVDKSIAQGEETEYPIDPNTQTFVDQVSASLQDMYNKLVAAYMCQTASGDVVSFSDGADDIPMKSVIVTLEPIQDGSGDPSPSNVRAISGYDSVSVDANGTEYSVTFPSNVGTVYGGTLDMVSGELIINYCFHQVVPSSVDSATVIGDNIRCGIYKVHDAGGEYASGLDCNAVSNYLPLVQSGYNRDETGFYVYNRNGIYIKLPVSVLSSADITGFRQYLTDNPLDIVYLMETPITYQLTTHQIETLLGSNTITSTDGTLTVTYRVDTNLFLNAVDTTADEISEVVG